MAEIDFNDLINPVGSTAWHSQWNYKGVDDRAFHYSEGNPYMKLIEDMLKSKHYKPEEIGDLYAKAYQYEGDTSRWLQQLKVDQAIKQEQREYDNPVNQVARSRAAGINLDVAGSSGGSGSGTGTAAGATAPDNVGSTGRTDPYAGKYYQLAAIQTAAQFAQTMVDSTATIMGAVSQMKMVPSQIALNEANAGLDSAKANEINTLLTGKQKSIDLANTNAYLGQLAEMSHLLRPDATDEDFNTTLAGLGLAEEQIPTATNVIRQFHKDPLLLARFAQSKTQQRWSEEENAQYTASVVAEMVELQRNIDYEQKHWTFQTTQLQGKIAGLLNTDSFAEQTASNEMTAELLEGQALTIKGDEMELYSQQLAYDTATFLRGIEERATTITSIDTALAALHKQPRSPERDAQINRLNAERIGVRTMLSNEFYKIKDAYLVTAQQIYQNQAILDSNNHILPEGQRSSANFFSDVTFNDLIHHTRTPDEIANSWVRTAVDAAGVAVDAAGVARGFHFNKTYKEAHNGMQFKKGFKEGQAGAFSF